MPSATEAELGTLFVNAKITVSMHHTLIKLGHPQSGTLQWSAICMRQYRGQSCTWLESCTLTKTLVFLVQSGLAISCTVMCILLPATGQGRRRPDKVCVIHTTADSSAELQKPTELSQGKQIKGTTQYTKNKQIYFPSNTCYLLKAVTSCSLQQG